MPDGNSDLFHLINGLAGNSSLADSLGQFASNALLYVLGTVVLSLGAWQAFRGRQGSTAIPLITAALSLVIALGIGLLAKRIFAEPRPFITQTDVHMLVARPADYSFPANHAAAGAALATAAAFAWPRWSALWILAAGLVGLAPIYVGVHYPVDVAAGFALGVSVAVTVHILVVRRTRGWHDEGGFGANARTGRAGS
jgi:membrane-associated phospholipid phosphatase